MLFAALAAAAIFYAIYHLAERRRSAQTIRYSNVAFLTAAVSGSAWADRALAAAWVCAVVLLAIALAGWATISGAFDVDISPATLVSSSASLACALFGMVLLPRSRLEAYRWFERSVLISVFFTQVFVFWEAQLAALGGLIWNLVLLTVLRFLIRQETGRIVTEN